LGVRARNVVVGVERVREAARKGHLHLALIATDASSNALGKIVPLLVARRISFIEMPSAAQLGALSGRESIAAAGIVDRDLANGVRALLPNGTPGRREDV
jgi:ribosomal protein L7Ae-like RNA K-turn-binding protein